MVEFSACETPDILRVIYFIKILINIVKTLIPILLIVMVSIDCAKGVISDAKKIDEALKPNKNRLISAVLIFAVPSIINLFLEIIDEETTYESCWANAESSTIEKYQLLWDAEEERKRQEEEEKRQEQLQQNVNLVSSPDISFSYKYISDGQTLPYGLFTPSTAKTNKTTPLIIWLHGSGEVYGRESSFIGSGMLDVINQWQLDGFNAYILCPHLAGDKAKGPNWEAHKKEFYKLVDKIIAEKNINKDNISIIGHSLGGSGVVFMSYDKTEYYSSVVIMSAYGTPSYDKLNSLKKLPVKGYTENSGNALAYTSKLFTSVFGKDKLTIYEDAAHGEVPKMALTEDANNDNKSDLIEWMLRQGKIDSSSSVGSTSSNNSSNSSSSGSDKNNTTPKIEVEKIDTTDLGCTLYYDTANKTLKTSLYFDKGEAAKMHQALTNACSYVNSVSHMSYLQTAGSYVNRPYSESDYHSVGLAIDLNNQWTYTKNGTTYRPYGGQGVNTWGNYQKFICDVCDGKENCTYNVNYQLYHKYFKSIGWCWGGNWSTKYFDPMHFEKSRDGCYERTTSITC